MANDHDDPTDTGQENPLARPRFLVAGVVVLLIVALGGVLIIRNAQSREVAEQPPVESSQPSTTTPPRSTTPTAAASSVCGLDEPRNQKPVTKAPAAVWQYEGTVAYPTSPEYGPGETAPEGYQYCFQHSAAGAVFATSNALALPDSDSARRSWIDYFVSSGPGRGELLATMASDSATSPTGVRVRVIGFKMLAYDNSTASVDIAVEAAGSGESVLGSYVYQLRWQDGDWKLNSDAAVPFNFSTISETALPSYVPWGE